jgi:hypothetical protein
VRVTTIPGHLLDLAATADQDPTLPPDFTSRIAALILAVLPRERSGVLLARQEQLLRELDIARALPRGQLGRRRSRRSA